MYSGTTLTPLSGRVAGAHQKIDRLARSSLSSMLKNNRCFPSAKAILHFEGVNGPDAIKRKSPAKNEPWHYYAPFDEADNQLVELISDHYKRLVRALANQDDVRAAFESAWLAHALVDGLTPAHHYPYEEKLSELRGGEGLASRTTLKGKILMPGKTRRQQVHNNWKMWGPRGLLTAHGLFEWGIAAILIPVKNTHKRIVLTDHDLAELHEHNVAELFRRKAKEIAALGMYDRYMKYGWTPQLARQVRRQLAPTIVKMVTLAWYAAALEAGIAKA
ncbi:MAG TPA: hypothetical protein VMY99_03920 [Nevskiaceae bacterium]|nr:hypothetical protein [Nevskiaceae bacterium]